MPSTVTLAEFGLVLFAPTPDPQVFHLDSLQNAGVMTPSDRWIAPPLYLPSQITLAFEQGKLSVEPNRIQVSQELTSTQPPSL